MARDTTRTMTDACHFYIHKEKTVAAGGVRPSSTGKRLQTGFMNCCDESIGLFSINPPQPLKDAEDERKSGCHVLV